MITKIKALLLISASFLVSGFALSPRYVITAPNVLYVGVPQKVLIELFDVKAPHNITVDIRVATGVGYGRKATIASYYTMVPPDKPGSVVLKVDPKHILLKSSEDKYVYIGVRARGPELNIYSRYTKVHLSYRDGIILIQTDKPIYTPNQKVIIRVVPLEFDLMPSMKKAILLIKNPQGIIVQQWDDLDINTGFITETLTIGAYAMTGNWTIEAYYGHLHVHNESITFEVREYVLPRFSANIKGPNYILRNPDASFVISGGAKYTYGKYLEGTAAVRLSILRPPKDPPFALLSLRLKLVNGTFSFPVQVNFIKNALKDKWFPEGHRLQVEADVTEKSTGKTERAVENSIYFVTSPYRIQYVDTPRYFKPGLPFVVKVVVTYPNKKLAMGIRMNLTATAEGKDGKEIAYTEESSTDKITVTDEKGEAEFVINIAREVKRLNIKTKTVVTGVPKKQNAVKALVALASVSTELIKLRQNKKPARVGSNGEFDVFLNNDKVDRVTYLVVSRGQIVLDKTINRAFGTITTLTFKVNSMMSPSARLVAYYISKETRKVISDSILLDIGDRFPNPLAFIPTNRHSEVLPSRNYDLKVLGTLETNVGILAVDESIYLLSKANLLSPESVFKKLEDLDLGCGPGSGRDSVDVFKNAGIAVISKDIWNSYWRCREQPRRKKRSIPEIENRMDFCCGLGNKTDENDRSCLRRTGDLDVDIFEEQKLIDDCKLTFFRCCVHKFGKQDMGMMGRSFAFLQNDPENYVEEITLRQDFKETWIAKSKIISKKETGFWGCYKYLDPELQPRCGSLLLPATLPDTITTWVVQAIGVSNKTGFGMAKPLRITTFKPFFIYLSMPYSVQRGEEITILATVFNYKGYDELVNLYLKGDKRMCSAATPGNTDLLTKQKRLVVRSQSSVSFAITIVPLKYGEIPIDVTAIGRNTDDRVIKKLLVVPEGVEERLTQSYVLDPQGSLKSPKIEEEELQNDAEKLPFDSLQIQNITESKQIDKIKLKIPGNAIRESVTAKIFYTGNMMAQALDNLEAGKMELLLQLPGGCGEQNMARIAPNVYALNYLEKTNQMTEEMRSKIDDFIHKGYTYELAFRKKDGGFGVWREEYYKGKTKLTAYVVKVFCQAQKLKDVNIPKSDLCGSAKWLLGKQRSDGAFVRELKATSSPNEDVDLTSSVVIALRQCQCGGASEAKAMQRAVAFLEKSVPKIESPYYLAITTYALALVNSSAKYEANQKLIKKAKYNPATSTRYWETYGKARNVKTAGYALLAQVEMDRLEYAGPIVIWLTKQRSYGGGFVSTKDTVVALEALAKYSERAKKMQLKLVIKTNLGNNVIKTLRKENAFLQQSDDVTGYVGKELKVETDGSGVGEMQVDIKYNVPSKKGYSCFFYVNVTLTEDGTGKVLFSAISLAESNDKVEVKPRQKRAANNKKKHKGKKGRKRGGKKGKGKKSRKGGKKKENPKPTKRIKNRKDRKEEKNSKANKNSDKKSRKRRSKPSVIVMTACARYAKSGDTGMAIIDMGILTGYNVDEDTLVKMVKKENNSVARYELSDRAVVFYLDKIESNRSVCVAFRFIRLFEVHNIQPVPVTVYDYYEPEKKCTVFYNLGKRPTTMRTCRDSICKCTQGKCPKENPKMSNIKKTRKVMCQMFNFAIQGNVTSIDEDNTFMNYSVKVLKILKQGTKEIVRKKTISFRKRIVCMYPNLEIDNALFIMGRDKDGIYQFDERSFVKILKNRKDMATVRKLARSVKKNKCSEN